MQTQEKLVIYIFMFPKLSKKSDIFSSWYLKSCCSNHWAISEKSKRGVEYILFDIQPILTDI